MTVDGPTGHLMAAAENRPTTGPQPRLVGGMDGCRGGWVLVTTPAVGGGPSRVSVVPDLRAVIAMVDGGELAAVAIDVPIGLPDRGPRSCDVAARRMLGPRGSSVFPAPVRAALGAAAYEEACARSVAASGKSLSRQAFGILPRIEEADRAMTPARQASIVEVHPEVVLAVMAGAPMTHYKRTPEGRAERRQALRRFFGDLDAHTRLRLAMTSPDDVLDAFAAAWTARRWVAGTHLRLGGELDRRGLRMEIIA